MEVRNGSSQLKFANYGKDEIGARAFTCRGVWCVGDGQPVDGWCVSLGLARARCKECLGLLYYYTSGCRRSSYPPGSCSSPHRQYNSELLRKRLLCFLVAYHGIRMSLSTLKRRLRRLNPRRRGCYGSLYYTGQCVLVIAIVFVMNYVLCTYKQRELNCSGSLLGYRAMHMRLRQRYGVITHLRS